MSRPSRAMEVAVMWAEDKSVREIAQTLGMSEPSVYRYLPSKHPARSDVMLAAEAWADFLGTLIEYEIANNFQGAIRVNDRKLVGDRWPRTLRRWREELSIGPPLRVVDEFLAHVGLHLNAFLDWCAEHDRDPWVKGAPEWEVCRDDYEERIGEALRERFPLRFERAWLEAMAVAGPAPAGWNESLDDDPTPMEVLRRAMEREYNAARMRQEEQREAVLLVQ